MAGTDVEFDTSEMRRLIVGLDRIPVSLHAAVTRVTRDSIVDLRDEWRDNADETARRHGKHYPGTITFEMVDQGWAAVVGPVSARWQGGMGEGFEYGSRNQPPHLDGNRAADTIFPRYERRVGIAAEDVFRGLG